MLARWPPTNLTILFVCQKKNFLNDLQTKIAVLAKLVPKLQWMTIFNDCYVLYCHTFLNTTNYCLKMVGTKTVPERPSWETVHLYKLFVASRMWDSINYSWDWTLLLVFVRWPKCQVQLTALGRLGKLWLEISWWTNEVLNNLKQKNWSVGCNLSKTAIKKTIQQK